jgi:hypothetical protein
VAFQADEATDNNLKIKIIPVGLEFSNYQRFRQVLTVVYGKPIEVSEFHELYMKSPEIALNELRARLSCEIKRLIVHIDSLEDYEAIDELRAIVNGRYSDDIRFPKLFRDRALIEKLNQVKGTNPTLYQSICSLSLEVRNKTGELKTEYRLLAKKKHPLVLLIAGMAVIVATFPLFLFGSIFTLTFLEIPKMQIRKIKDIQFHSSIRYGLSLALALLILPVCLILLLIFVSPWWLGLLIFIAIPLTGLFAWNYALFLRRIIGGFRIRKYIKENNKVYLDLKKNHDELMNLIASL